MVATKTKAKIETNDETHTYTRTHTHSKTTISANFSFTCHILKLFLLNKHKTEYTNTHAQQMVNRFQYQKHTHTRTQSQRIWRALLCRSFIFISHFILFSNVIAFDFADLVSPLCNLLMFALCPKLIYIKHTYNNTSCRAMPYAIYAYARW